MLCNNSCPLHCNSSCTRLSGVCLACQPGFHGHQCGDECGNCSTKICEQSTGNCPGECIYGFYDSMCSTVCQEAECLRCQKDTGTCLECRAGMYGTSCEHRCSENCGDSSDGLVYCDMTTGECVVDECRHGYYGPGCSQTCPDNCKENATIGQVICGFNNGLCLDGCTDGWQGFVCEVQCSTNCLGEPGICQQDGYCINGCGEDFFGYNCSIECSSTCIDNTCDRDTGHCLDCLTNKAPSCRDAGNMWCQLQ